MKVITLAAQKGGAGKTTIAVHLAVQASESGERVVLVDTDPQGSASAWAKAREGSEPIVVVASTGQLKDVISMAKAEAVPVTLMIIDTPPHLAPTAAAAAAAADLVIIPVRPSAFDLAASGASAKIARTAKRAVFLLSACPSRAPEIMETREALSEHGIPVLESEIGERRAFARAVASGRAVAEFEPDGRAAREIRALWREIKKVMGK
jgi:chromosome partitioning protein